MVEYVLRIICCALILGALGSIGGAGGGVRRVVYGLLLTFVIISPLGQIRLEQVLELPEVLYEQGQDLSSDARSTTSEAIQAVIKEEVESYILVEAGSLGAQIRVDAIILDDASMVPVEVVLEGSVSPWQRQLLSQYLWEELGIGKERQKWIGQP